MASSFLIALSDNAVSAERGHRVWQKAGTITVTRRDWHFSDDYAALPVPTCREIGKAVEFLLADRAASEVDFEVAGESAMFRATRLN